MPRLDGKVVVVTGAARGQGAAEALALAEEGATVIATDVAESGPPGVEYRRLDVGDPLAWAALASELDVVHGLVNNAGVTLRSRLDSVTVADFERVLRVNVTGSLLGIQALSALMTEGGSIVNVGSLAALTGHYASAYTISKWAVRGLSRVASLELGPRGIRVNTIHPGYIETPMTASAPGAFKDISIAEAPLGRLGAVEDVAPLVVFLISDESSFISGAEIPVDGGHSAHGGVKGISDLLRGLT
jgi:3alpha(or 20beta)-hydroxysteroid dehydrogenase